MIPTRKLLVIIVTFNSSASIIRCLESVKQQSLKNFEVHIIDNASSDNTIELIKRFLNTTPILNNNARLALNKENYGFAKAVNMAMSTVYKKTGNTDVLLLNPDTSFDYDFFQNGLKWLNKNKKLGACVPIIVYPNGTIWWIGTKLYNDLDLIFKFKYSIGEHILKGKKIPKNWNFQKNVDAITGCALFIKSKALDKVGLLNERYFMYAEDVDYSVRLRKHGFQLGLISNSKVTHYVDDNSKKVISSFAKLKKYRIYLKSIGTYLLENKSFFIFLLWIAKLPFSLLFHLKSNANES